MISVPITSIEIWPLHINLTFDPVISTSDIPPGSYFHNISRNILQHYHKRCRLPDRSRSLARASVVSDAIYLSDTTLTCPQVETSVTITPVPKPQSNPVTLGPPMEQPTRQRQWTREYCSRSVEGPLKPESEARFLLRKFNTTRHRPPF